MATATTWSPYRRRCERRSLPRTSFYATAMNATPWPFATTRLPSCSLRPIPSWTREPCCKARGTWRQRSDRVRRSDKRSDEAEQPFRAVDESKHRGECEHQQENCRHQCDRQQEPVLLGVGKRNQCDDRGGRNIRQRERKGEQDHRQQENYRAGNTQHAVHVRRPAWAYRGFEPGERRNGVLLQQPKVARGQRAIHQTAGKDRGP